MSILFLIASLGAINGALLALYLISKKQASVADRYFGWLILTLSIRIGKSVFFYFDKDADRLILQLGLSACLFIGPFFYLYTKALLSNQQHFKKQDKLLLAIFFLVITIVGVAFPYQLHPEIWNHFVVKGIYLVWIIFTVLGLFNSWKMLKGESGKIGKITGEHQYVLAVAIAMLFITSTYQFALFVKGFTYIWGAVAFSFSFYYLLARALLRNKSIAPKNTNPPIENADVLLRRVNKWMEEQKPFVSQKLKLDELASQTGLTRHLLSRVLNEEYVHGFSHYVQSYRVNEAKQLIATRPELSLEGIGYEAGFSSKSSFFEAFKKMTKSTPAAYKKTLEVLPA